MRSGPAWAFCARTASDDPREDKLSILAMSRNTERRNEPQAGRHLGQRVMGTSSRSVRAACPRFHGQRWRED
jgi:hypothetical protein